MMAKKGSEKQIKFLNVYDGTNLKEAAAIAGLSYGYARILITKPNILQAIQERSSKENSSLIATRQRRQEFWTETMEDQGKDMKDRLRASELLGKSEADFVERVEQSGPDGGPIENKWIVEIVKPGGK